MLPGALAGEYSPEAIQIDLQRLCDAAGADLVIGAATSSISIAVKYPRRKPDAAAV